MPVSVVLPPRSVAQNMATLNVFGFFGVALLSGLLAEGLMADARLRRRRSGDLDLQALNQYVIDSLPSGLATTDAAHLILTFNRAAEHITGVPFLSAVRRPVAEVLQLPAPLIDTLQSDPASSGVQRTEFRFHRVDGRPESRSA